MRRFPFQFLLSDREISVEPTWVCEQAGDWKLYADPRLPMTALFAADGGRIGWLIGFPRGDTHPVPGLDTSWERIEEWLYKHGGRFALILMSPQPRIYLDPFGAYSVVYSKAQRVVASSIGLVPGKEPDSELIETYDIPNADRWYPFGLTQRLDVFRLLPNHYLDLDDWTTHRHWPGKRDASGAAPDDEETFERIAELLEREIGAIATAHRCCLMLTAGQDSRMLLACARRFMPRIKLTTVDVGDAAASLDCRVAARLARLVGLPHEVVPRKLPTEVQLHGWLLNTGYCVAGRAWKNVGTRSRLDPDIPCLSGFGGEIGRGYWWWRGDGSKDGISPEELLQRMSLPATARVLRAAQDWIATVPEGFDRRGILELAYIEQRLGCWAGPQQFGYSGNAPNVMPFCHREIIQLMLSLSVEAREQGRLARAVILRKWPELMALPFNEEPGLAGYGRRVARQVVRVRDAVRRRIARLMAMAAAKA